MLRAGSVSEATGVILIILISLSCLPELSEGRGHGGHGGHGGHHSSTAHGSRIGQLHIKSVGINFNRIKNAFSFLKTTNKVVQTGLEVKEAFERPTSTTTETPTTTTTRDPATISWCEHGDSMWHDLKWGFGTSAYQVEGAHNIDGRGPSIWDNWTHRQPSLIADNSTGDVACDSYHNYRTDVSLMANLGVQIYRFSISWSRILPNGTKGSLNPKGILYYSNLIDELLANDIEPLVTMYHFDLPQALQDQGGFLNENLIVQHFTDYAEILFKNFGNRVKRWVTFNEPWAICVYGYETGVWAPGVVTDRGGLTCGHTLLKTHANVYQLYKTKFKKEQGGVIGLSLVAPWFSSYDWINSTDKVKTDADTDKALQEVIGWFAHPVTFGSYPPALQAIHGSNIVPKFDSTWSAKLKGSADFLGLNHYTTFWVKNGKWYSDLKKTEFYHVPSTPSSASSWLKSQPYGLRQILRWTKFQYQNPVIYITENGFSDTESEGLNDQGRIDYLRSYTAELEEVVRKDHIDVQVYTVWSLLDNFEWTKGYSERFGVFSVDFKSPSRTRTAKASAEFLAIKFSIQRRRGKFYENGEYVWHSSPCDQSSGQTVKAYHVFKLIIVGISIIALY